MIEKLARAICCHKGGKQTPCAAQYDGSPFSVCQAHTYMDDARACLEALREPTPEMVKAGDAWTNHHADCVYTIWQSMIDVALGEGDRSE